MLGVSRSDLIVLTYCGIADSGVRVIRVRGADGRVVFTTECDGLGVPHSKYSQRVTAEITQGRLIVFSHGAGWFKEDAHQGPTTPVSAGAAAAPHLAAVSPPARVNGEVRAKVVYEDASARPASGLPFI